MHFFKRLIDWRSLILQELQVLELVIENKLLLVVSWRISHVYRISFPLLRKSCNDTEFSVVLLLPHQTNHIDIVFKNRRKTVKETINQTSKQNSVKSKVG